MKAKLIFILILIFNPEICASEEASLKAIRREYNLVLSQIDSLVRNMADLDVEALNTSRLPDGTGSDVLPKGMSAVMIFWADDEAKVWVNDYFVGETRLTPVEVTVPSLYLRSENRIRVRCWDTDWVESGFLGGLYLKDAAGTLFPIVVSDGRWEGTGEPVREITYAHSIPDIPGAKVIWASQIFGKVEFSVAFDPQAIQQAKNKAMPEAAGNSEKREMKYHDFVRGVAALEERRDALKASLEGEANGLSVPAYSGSSGMSLSLTLGKVGPLKEWVNNPVAQSVKSWARNLPEEQRKLVYPESRELKGEEAANLEGGDPISPGSVAGSRDQVYKPPEERGSSRSNNSKVGSSGELGVSGRGTAGEGGEGTMGIGDGMGRGYRLGLLFPTLILAFYVGYVVFQWKDITGGERTYPWRD